MRENELMLSALRERLAPGHVPAAPNDIALAESQLGFRLPPLLRQLYGLSNGRIGPGFGLLPIDEGEDTLVTVYRDFADTSYVPEPGEVGFDQYPWPERLLPIVDWAVRFARASTVAPTMAPSSRHPTAKRS